MNLQARLQVIMNKASLSEADKKLLANAEYALSFDDFEVFVYELERATAHEVRDLIKTGRAKMPPSISDEQHA